MDAKLILNVNKLYQLSSKFRGEPLLVLPQIVVVGDQVRLISLQLLYNLCKRFINFIHINALPYKLFAH